MNADADVDAKGISIVIGELKTNIHSNLPVWNMSWNLFLNPLKIPQINNCPSYQYFFYIFYFHSFHFI